MRLDEVDLLMSRWMDGWIMEGTVREGKGMGTGGGPGFFISVPVRICSLCSRTPSTYPPKSSFFCPLTARCILPN